ncbi:DUF421 domain-containing protein [Terrimonas sp. NA20]|uniref:DUF421 domain-containing protein n=1 Tax=Terrimonas ginsenosidimutans TaxID=2908004 RepID=A0ABS9KNM7_9BACT|nr:DUF421 domain-containing protein [Terrimonas ginsenosidimutans]MCG2613932.1 DUF421 domain-containing protein [Terrimonas ginsenosidimutans]
MFILDAGKFSWKEILLGSEEWTFLPEVIIRSLIMFAVILFSLSILGKRGVRQLSVFELVVIIGLGSAAGDPMFYKDVGLIPALIVFTIVIGLYIFVTHLVGRSKKVARIVEGKPICLIREGRFAINNFSKENLGQDEFFAELRLKGVSHLGQVEQAIIETNGDISVFFYEDEDVRYGLPVMPDSLDHKAKQIKNKGYYSCSFCGNTESIDVGTHHCGKCQKDDWVASSNRRRIT